MSGSTNGPYGPMTQLEGYEEGTATAGTTDVLYLYFAIQPEIVQA